MTDKGLEKILDNLPKLKSLDLWGTEITDMACTMLEQKRPDLTNVSVNDTNVSEKRFGEFEISRHERMRK